ncbi:MAG: carboxypeptidase-like regulatory domain-containing protein [Proteobacteria bacterium]|nr:carboxypeptidase-like regulatory domain-containing protein [Pseudomonadota bacterium]
MRMRAGLVAIAATVACHPPTPGRPLARPGATGMDTLTDDGAGALARLSIGWRRDEHDDVDDHATVDDRYVDPASVGGDPYGGRAYAAWRAPSYTNAPSRLSTYVVASNLKGVVEGRITWQGAAPMKLPTPCGLVDNPSLHVDAARGLAGTLVYIEKVTTGRLASSASLGRPAVVGGELFKRGCALVPTAQIAAPGPIRLAIHADTSATLHVVPPIHVGTIGGAGTIGGTILPSDLTLQDAARGAVSLASGVTRIEGVGLVPAWVMVLDTAYFAITDDAGRFRIDELAAGTYGLTIWHAPIVTATGTTLAFDAPIVAHRTIVVADGRPARVDVALGR